MARRHEPEFPDRLEVLWNDRIIAMESYGSSRTEEYYKGKRPGGGTVEVHVLFESYFDDHPHASGDMPEPEPDHRTR